MSEDKISVGEIIVATLSIGALAAGTLQTVKFVKKAGGIKPAKDKVVAKVANVAAIGSDLLSDSATRLKRIKLIKKKLDESIARDEAEIKRLKVETSEQAEFEVVTDKVTVVAPEGKDILEIGVKQFVGYIPKDKTEGLESGMMGDATVSGRTNIGVGIIVNGAEIRVAGTVVIEGVQGELEPLIGATGLKYVLEKEPENIEDPDAVKVYLTV